MAGDTDRKPKPENYKDVPPMVTIRWLFERRIAELLDQVEYFRIEMGKVLVDEEQRATFGVLALTAQAAADEIKDALMPLFGQFIELDLPLAADMAIYYVDVMSKETMPGTWGPIHAKAGDVVVHLKAKEDTTGDEVDMGSSESEAGEGSAVN